MRIVVFQQQGSGEAKIRGVRQHGRDIEIVRVFSVDAAGLPAMIDDPEQYISDDFEADLVLDFLRHPDLSDYLVDLCRQKKIPVIASGKKNPHAICPFTCCGLGWQDAAGAYGRQFGLPEVSVVLDEDQRIVEVTVHRGAPCGATWDTTPLLIGLTLDEARVRWAREIQYICKADPANFDPVSGKSQLHYAGKVHSAALHRSATGSPEDPSSSG
jgi:hypothetical protein